MHTYFSGPIAVGISFILSLSWPAGAMATPMLFGGEPTPATTAPSSNPETETHRPPKKKNAKQDDRRKKSEAAVTAEPGALVSEESLVRFQQLLLRKPLHHSAFKGLVRHYAEQGRLQDLVREYEQKVEALPDEPALRILLARLCLRAGRAERAAHLIDTIVDSQLVSVRDASKLLVFKSEVYQRTGRLEAARSMLKEALARARTISERMKLSEGLADLHLRGGDKAKAAEVLIGLASEFPDQYLHRKRIAGALAQRGLHEQAVEQYRSILELCRDETARRCEVLQQLGRSLERLERRQEAIDVYAEAINLLAGGHWLQRDLHERIVTLYRASDRLEDLVRYCREQIERSPQQTAMRGLLADVQAATGDIDGAKQTLVESVQLFPKDRDLSQRRIRFLERYKDAQGAASEYERIMAQYPEDIELFISYGQFLANHERLEAARNQWKHVLNSEVTDASLAHRLGGLFEPYEMYDDAVDCYERAIALSPERPESYTALSRLWLFRGKKEKAIEPLRRMARANPDDAAVHAQLCQAMMNLGLADEALAAITRACELDSEQVRYRMNRADLLVRTGQVSEAMKVRRSVVDLIRNPRQQAMAIDVLVSMHASADQLDALKASEKTRLESDPADAVSLLVLARAADFDRKFSEARDWLGRLLEAHPANEEARRQLARLYEVVGDVDAAVDAYRKLIELHPTRGRPFYQAIADLKLRYQDKAGAIETFEAMVQASPRNATALKSVAEQLVRLGEFEKGITYYEQSLQVQPDRHEVRLAYGKALLEAGRLEEALSAFKKTALQRADRDSAVEALGKLHETAGQLGATDDLLQELQARVESNPEDTLKARALAELLIREYEYDRAMSLLDLVLRHDPREAELQLVRAHLLRRLARFDDALEAYRRVLRLPDIDRDFILGEMGKACFEAGRIEQARGVWRQIRNKLYAGTLLRNNGLLDDAIEVLGEGIRLKPDDFGLRRNLIRALNAAGKIDEALAAWRRLLDLEPDNVFNIRQLALAYLERGDRAAAATIAGRLFSAGVMEKKGRSFSSSSLGAFMGGGPIWAMSLQSAWGGFPGGMPRNNLDRGVRFFQENGLLAELEEILTEQLAVQPDNAILRQTAANLFSETFGKPEKALILLKELESASFPLEHQQWLGQCSQHDYMRVQQYRLIGSKPGLRDRRLARLESKPAETLSRDETLELAVIRHAQGAFDEAIRLLEGVVETDDRDVVAYSVLVDILVRAERFEEAEPHAKALIGLLAGKRERMQADMIERIRRDFVRTLPVRFQLRISDKLLRDIAHKWTLGQGFLTDFTGFVQTMGYFRARLTLATIFAKSDRMEQARAIWEALAPPSAADADGWTLLAGIAQLHGQNDLAYRYYEKALQAAKLLMADPLLQRIYSGTLSAAWYGMGETIDSSFNKIVEAFSEQDKLIELYDFLRETDQIVKARRVVEQYELYDDLKAVYRKRLEQAREDFRRSGDNPLNRSVPYFAQACKLAELHDQTGNWPEAEKTYAHYIEDFPDELGLLITLGEVAETQGEYEKAVQWERKVLEAKDRLVRKAREWALRGIFMTPAVPQVLQGVVQNNWEWQQRWGKGMAWWGYGSRRKPLERWPSWLRIAQLYLALDNPIAAGDAMERAIGVAGGERNEVGQQILALVRERQLTAGMLPVLRTLAVYLPTEEKLQLAFAESLESNDKGPVAAEVYRRMLRRGVSDVGVLARIRGKLKTLEPAAEEEAIDTLASLEAAVASDPENANNRLRLAKAYYYSLRVDKALETLLKLEEVAPHLEGLNDLLVEIYTILGDSEQLIEALQAKIKRSSKEDAKREARQRLVEKLLAAGQNEAALTELTKLVDPKDPSSYERVGTLLHYFGRHDEAVEQFELAGRSRQSGAWGGDQSKIALARAMVVKGDLEAAAEKIIDAVETQSRQMSQYGGMAGMFAFFDTGTNHFDPFVSLFVLQPALLDKIRERLMEQYEANPDDPQAAKHLMQLYRRVGRPDSAEAILEKMTDKGVTDQTLMAHLIDRAIQRREYEKAIEMADGWIAQQPKPTLPPGMPPQFAGMMTLMSPRNLMICKVGDIYWKMGDAEKAFERYRQILDEKVDESRIAYAAICALHGRIDEARERVDEALSGLQVKSPTLLQFRALLAALDNDPEKTFDLLAKAEEIGAGQAGNPFAMGLGGSGNTVNLLASLARRTGQIDRFVAFMKKRIKKNPNEWERHHLLARTYYEAGRIEDAFAVLDEAAKVKSLKRQVLAQRMKWREGHAPPDDLIHGYRKLIRIAEKQIKPRSSLMSTLFGGGSRRPPKIDTQPLRDRLGDLLWQRGEHDAAEAVWTQRMNLKAASSHITQGKRYQEKRDYDRAESCFLKAIELEPTNTTAHEALAGLTYHRRDGASAVEHLREVFLRRYTAPRPPSRRPWEYQPTRNNQSTDSLRVWAIDLARDPEIAAHLHEADSDEAADARLTLATLTGDWASAESELRRRLESSPYDPMVWTLWAQLKERQGAWSEAAKALDTVRRLKRTSLPRHRDRLKLVLAGKHIKDAAAGIKRTTPALPGMPVQATAAAMAQMSSYYNMYPGNVDDEAIHLAALYVKLEQYDQAERLYLFGNSGGRNSAQSMLPALSALMWRQGARDRAAELMELAVILSQDTNLIPQYAGMLAEMDQTEAAADLLVRAYRCVRKQSYGNPFGMMFGTYGGGREDEFEDYQEQSLSSALYDIIRRKGAFETVLTGMKEQLAEETGDTRAARLMLSLQIRDRRWEEARDSLTAWRESRPNDPAVATELLHVNLRLEDWDAALGILEELRNEVKESENRWRMYDAFIRLMQGDADAAVAAIEPLLDDPMNLVGDMSPHQVLTVLAATEHYERLISFMEAPAVRNAWDDQGRGFLCRLYRIEGRWADAARIALDRFWKQPGALDASSGEYQSLTAVVRAAEAVGKPVEPDTNRAEDRALVTLVSEGPAAGKKAFRALATENPDNVNARRGLILSAGLDGDPALATEANNELIHWLESRRREIWIPAVHRPLNESAAAFLKTLQARQTDSSAALGMSLSFMSLIQEVLGINRRTGQETGARTYEVLWRAHHRLQRDLLLRSDQADRLAGLLKTQAEQAEAERHRGDGRSSAQGISYYPGLINVPYNYGTIRRSNQGRSFARDWHKVLRDVNQQYRRIGSLIDQFKQLGSRIAETDWHLVSELYAAVGDDAEARRWRRRAVEARFAQIRATDAPRVESDEDRYAWRWRMYGRTASQNLQVLRSAFRVSLKDPDRSLDDEAPSPISGRPDKLWELALFDPEVEANLLKLADALGPGWDESQSLKQLISYFRAKDDPRRIIELIERVLDPDQLLQSRRLSDYMGAGFEAQDYARIDKVLAGAGALSSSLENDILLLRLMMLRHQGRDAEADTLEERLLKQCHAEPVNPYRLDPRLLSSRRTARSSAQAYGRTGGSYGLLQAPRFIGGSFQVGLNDLSTTGSLARALGLRYQSDMRPEDLSMRRIRESYVRHRLHPHAARIADLELAQSPGNLNPRQRAQLIAAKAKWLRLAGDGDAAREVLAEAEAFWLDASKKHPADAQPESMLATIYASKGFGPDYEKAYNALSRAKRIDPTIDPSGHTAAMYLYKLGRYDEAWERYQHALAHGRKQSQEATNLYRAGIAACESGDRTMAVGLLRQALWCDPGHGLAVKAWELIDENHRTVSSLDERSSH